LKSRVHRGLPPSLLFFRDAKGSEVDLVVEDGRSLFAIETKSGRTIAGDFFGGLEQFRALAAEARPDLQTKPFLVYGGAEAQKRTLAEVIPWSELDRHSWWEA
ncbi:MAG TPA: AAA family ATPase, partial [Thermoanaerobaculia bacterium]|nr:AAA family ATPase [Thermoanaerobaculia bacterium]